MRESVDTRFKSSFHRPGIYKIVVEGDLSKNISYIMNGMQFNVSISQEKDPVTTLIGQISDQSALMGVLNTLYDHHNTILSVSVLKE